MPYISRFFMERLKKCIRMLHVPLLKLKSISGRKEYVILDKWSIIRPSAPQLVRDLMRHTSKS